jgi:thiamine pyrophosphokinase
VESHTNQVIVLSGGEPIAADRDFELPEGAYVIAADSGLHHAVPLGLTVDLVVGDMDSVEPGALAAAVEAGSLADRHPVEKDRTDLELALTAAIAAGAERILVVGSHEGRLDHLLGSMGLFASTARLVDEIVWTDGRTIVTACTPTHAATIRGQIGDRVSLIPIGPDVRGVTTDGLAWRLSDETLAAGSTRGVSNVADSPEATISVTDGTLLVIHERTRP